MRLGMKNGMLVKSGYTARDYSQDGLVVRWDGIENDGWGVHNPGITTLKDLVGEMDMPMPASGLFVGPDSLYTTTRQDFNIAHNVSQSLADAINGGNCTINFCGRAYCADGTNDGIMSIYASSTVRPLTLLAVSASSGTVRRAQAGILGGGSNIVGSGSIPSWTRTNNERATISFVFTSDGKYKQFKNGGEIANGNITMSQGALATTNMSLMILTYATNPSFDGEMCGISIYNRALSADEIAATYAIDKARFNLPEA